MGTTTDKLNKLVETKAAIKAAIEAKGVADVGDKFSDYPAKIESIQSGSIDGNPFVPNDTWWDIENILIEDNKTITDKNKLIVLFNSTQSNFYISNSDKAIIGYKTISKGYIDVSTKNYFEIKPNSNDDKECYIDGKYVYKTRYIIFYFSKTTTTYTLFNNNNTIYGLSYNIDINTDYLQCSAFIRNLDGDFIKGTSIRASIYDTNIYCDFTTLNISGVSGYNDEEGLNINSNIKFLKEVELIINGGTYGNMFFDNFYKNIKVDSGVYINKVILNKANLNIYGRNNYTTILCIDELILNSDAILSIYSYSSTANFSIKINKIVTNGNRFRVYINSTNAYLSLYDKIYEFINDISGNGNLYLYEPISYEDRELLTSKGLKVYNI